MARPDQHNVEAVVIGAGPAGLTAAIALAEGGIATALVAPAPTAGDNRTTALLASSVTALATLGVWERAQAHAAPLRVMRIADDTRRLLRAPEVSFAADEIGLEAFGHNIENMHLVAALAARAAELPLLHIRETALSIEPDDGGVTVQWAGGAVRALLAVGADGRNSPSRVAAGIGVDRRAYPQVALTFNLAHSRPHRDISTEFHTESGPFTLVPLPGQRSSLVCVLSPAEADHVQALSDSELALELERRSHSILGKLVVEPLRGRFPLASETARGFTAGRIALIGEAAHVMPPIGAQGLNLGLRDAADLAEIVVSARARGEDIGSVAVLARYDQRRRADAATRAFAIDVLNRSLLTDFLPVQGARGFGLYLLDKVAPLRRAVMREGVAPSGSLPGLMRGERSP